MFLKCDPYRVWCSIFYSKLVNCILLRSLFVFVKGRGTCGSGERNVKIWIDFRKSPRFSLTSPWSQEREVKSPCFFYVWWALYICMFGYVSMIILFDFGIVPTMCYSLLFISYFFWWLVDDDMFLLIQSFVLIVPVVFMLYLYYL